jgi:hypothetical protein
MEHLAGGEQAANTLQLDGNSRYATTANAKVSGAIEGLPLVRRCRCLRSHGRSHRFDPCHAHQHKQPPHPPNSPSLSANCQQVTDSDEASRNWWNG